MAMRNAHTGVWLAAICVAIGVIVCGCRQQEDDGISEMDFEDAYRTPRKSPTEIAFGRSHPRWRAPESSSNNLIRIPSMTPNLGTGKIMMFGKQTTITIHIIERNISFDVTDSDRSTNYVTGIGTAEFEAKFNEHVPSVNEALRGMKADVEMIGGGERLIKVKPNVSPKTKPRKWL